MRKGGKKRHIISMRISTEEWDSLQEIMKGLQLKRVSDLMREGFRQLLTPAEPFENIAAEGPERTG
jgi:hypothetical protein